MKSSKPAFLKSNASLGAYATVAVFAIAGITLLVRSYANPALESVEGEFVHSYVDYDDGREGDVYAVKDAVSGAYNRIDPNSMQENGKKLPRTGSKVRLKGLWDSGKLTIANTSDAVTVLEEAAVIATEPQEGQAAVAYRRAVYLLNLNGASGAQPVISQADMQRMHNLPTGPDKYWAETSYGSVDLKSTILPVISINASGTCSDSQVYTWADQAKAAARSQGIDTTAYTHELFVLPVSNCGWSGLGNINGPRSFIAYGYSGSRSDNEHNGTAAHEFGHNVGLRHSSSYRCTSGSTPVQISASCTASTYGDIFDVMGDSGDRNYMGRLLNGYHRVQLGYIPTSKVQTVTTSGNYRLASVNVNPNTTTAPQSIRVARSSSQSYDLEYRSTHSTALDAFASTDPVVNGVSVRLVPTALRASTSPLLLDSLPNTTTFTDAPSVGTAFSDSTARVSFKVVSRTATEVVVAVTINGVPPGPTPTPTPPTPTPPTPTPPTPTPPTPTDTTRPTVSLTAPATGGSAVVGSTVTMNANASDNVAVTRVEFYNGTTLLGSDTSSPYSFAWNTAGQAAGSKSLTARAFDAANNNQTSSAISYTLTATAPTDTAAPTVNLTAPTNGASVAVGSTVTMNASASDNVGVTRVDFYNGSTLLGSDTSSPYSYAWNTTGQATGSKSLTARAYDAAGNGRTSTAVSITLTGAGSSTPGDANGDGKVNALDLSVLISRDGQNYPPADFNGDGTVGAADMAILLARWTW